MKNFGDTCARTRANTRLGFTLAELLVAVTLMSVVMSSVYALTHASLRTWRHVEDGYDVHLEARGVMSLFSHEYNNIVGRAAHLFEGDKDEITMFVVAQPLNLDQGEGPRLMRVIYSYNRSQRTLEREEALVDAALPQRPLSDEELDRTRIRLSRRYKTTVADNVSSFSLRYIWAPLTEDPDPDRPPVHEPLIYQDRHNSLWGLPQAVEVNLELRDPGDRETRYPLTTVLPMRAPTVRRTRERFEEMFDARR